MAFASIKDIEPGSIVTFRSKNPNDTVIWEGTLESIGTYRMVRPYGDPRAYNQAVRQNDPSVASDVTVLTYFLITVNNQATDSTIMLFADEWIEPGSLNIVSLGNQVSLVVEDPANNVNAILSLLASAGYKVKVVS